MNATVIGIGSALVAFVMAACAVLLGVSLLPDRATVIEAGTLIPWYVAWMMVLGTTLVALVLAGYLVSTAMAGDQHR